MQSMEGKTVIYTNEFGSHPAFFTDKRMTHKAGIEFIVTIVCQSVCVCAAIISMLPADFICSFYPVVTLYYFKTHEYNFTANNDHHCACSVEDDFMQI